ncbi:hypothetical protein PTKIN_Ptkin11bG0151200 [Pterospermum kingtungense]
MCSPTSDLKDSGDKGKEVVVDECLENGSDLRHIYHPSSGHNINFFSPVVEDEEIVVIPPTDVLNEGLDLIVTVRDRILESGPWHINNQPLVFRKWVRGMKALEFNMSKRCAQCCIFGHSDSSYPKKVSSILVEPTKLWKPKQISKPEEKSLAVGDNHMAAKVNLISSSAKDVAKVNGKAGSVTRFDILNSDMVKDVAASLIPTVEKGESSSVASFMASIKVQVQNQIRDCKVNEASSKIKEDMVVFSKDKIKEDMVDLTKDKDKKVAIEEVSVSDAIDLSLKSKKSALLPVGMIRTPRVFAARVAEAIKAVKSQRKKSRRQAKKALASKS